MIISHKHKFIFIKNRKTAGTSIEISLSKLCGLHDIITPVSIEDEKVRSDLGFLGPQNYHTPISDWSISQWLAYFKNGKKPKRFYHHISTKEVVKLVPEKVWNSYFKFTFERNPFDKAVSFYYWRKADKTYKNISDFILDGGLDPLQKLDLYSKTKLHAVDKIYQYEDLPFFEKDFSKQLDLLEPFKLIKYKAKSSSRKISDYRKVLDDKSIELIKSGFAKEIEMFNYKF